MSCQPSHQNRRAPILRLLLLIHREPSITASLPPPQAKAAAECRMLCETLYGPKSLKNDEKSPRGVGMGRESLPEPTGSSLPGEKNIYIYQWGIQIDPGQVIRLCLWSVKGHRATTPASWRLSIILTHPHTLPPPSQSLPTPGTQQRHPSFFWATAPRLGNVAKHQEATGSEF